MKITEVRARTPTSLWREHQQQGEHFNSSCNRISRHAETIDYEAQQVQKQLAGETPKDRGMANSYVLFSIHGQGQGRSHPWENGEVKIRERPMGIGQSKQKQQHKAPSPKQENCMSGTSSWDGCTGHASPYPRTLKMFWIKYVQTGAFLSQI